jgi:hypothetical protein
MDRLSGPLFMSTLNTLAEVFDKKQVTPKALEVWFDLLKEFEENRVVACLKNWPKTHNKFPAPSEVWKVLNEDATVRREQVAEAEKKSFEQGYRRLERSPETEAEFKAVMELLKTPKPTPAEHWQRVVETPGLCSKSYEYADEFLSRRA